MTYDGTDPDDDGTVEANVDNQSVNTEDQSLGEDDSFGHPRLPAKTALPKTLPSALSVNRTTIDRCEDHTTWDLAQNGTKSDDSDTNIEGAQSIKWSGSAFGRLDYSLSATADLSSSHLAFWLFVPDPDALDNVQIYAKTNGFTDYYDFVMKEYKAGWNYIPISRGNFLYTGATGSPSWSQINSVSFGFGPNTSTSVNLDAVHYVQDPSSNAKISLRFDDASDALMTDVMPVLDQYDMAGAVAAPISDIGTLGKLTQDQLQKLRTKGWDIISHQINQTDITQLSATEAETELYESQKWLLDKGHNKGAQFFVPHAQFMDSEVADIVEQYYTNPAFWQSEIGDSGVNALPYRRGQRTIYSRNADGISESELTRLVDDAVTSNGHAVMHWHPPIDNQTAFENVISHIDSANIDVVTFSEVFE